MKKNKIEKLSTVTISALDAFFDKFQELFKKEINKKNKAEHFELLFMGATDFLYNIACSVTDNQLHQQQVILEIVKPLIIDYIKMRNDEFNGIIH